MSFFKQNTEKKIFYLLAGLLFILLPILSIQSGISGDEATYHHPHGVNSFNYYATFGKDTTCLFYKNSPNYMYGPVFDVIAVAVIKTFNFENTYLVRHILNAMSGWTAIFFAALIAVFLGGWRAGIITLIFMFLSPRFLGHAFNNPKDIPFAAAYIFTIYAIIKFLHAFPERKIHYGILISLGIGLAIGVRVGGILLAVYFILFAGLRYLLLTNYKDWLRKAYLKKLVALMVWALLISIAGYAVGVLLWPYVHKNPVGNTIQAMEFMEANTSRIRQLFEGKVLWSDYFPKYYLIKYILITIPEFILLGIISFIVLIRKMKRSYSLWYFILFFTAIFPIAYIIYKDSNVYGGWRHVLFIFPSLAVISALGVNKLISSFKQTYLQYIVMALFGLLTVLPIRHIIVNHPHEYIYYNTLVGGVKKAYGKYEMDYFYHSLKAASEWLIENKIEKANPGDGEKIIVASNFITPLKYYFRNYMDKVKLVYIRYYERGNTNWDYAVIANSYIDPYQMKKKTWPPSNTIKTIDVDGKPINAILERKDKSEFTGYTMLTGGNAEASIPFFKAAISKDRNYEMVYYNLAQAYLNTGQFDRALEAVSKSLKLYPTYDRALNLLGMIYLNKREYNNALQVFRKNMDLNPKYFLSVYYIGVLYAQSGDYNTALKYLEKTLDKSPRYKPAYILIAQILDLQGKKDLAKEYLNYANSLP